MSPAPSGAEATKEGVNLYELIRAVVVVAALVYVTVFLVRHYTEVKDVTAVLGIVVPVLAAVVGISLGYWSGNANGKAKGESGKAQATQIAKHELASKLDPLVGELEKSTLPVIDRMAAALSSEPGSNRFALRGAAAMPELSVTHEEVGDGKAAVARMRGILEAVD